MKLLLPLILLFVLGCGHTPPDSQQAYIQAKSCVKKQLKDPGSAEFDAYDPSKVTEISITEYTVRGNVRSKNSFGGMSNAIYSVGIEFTSAESWTEGCSCSNVLVFDD